jgi:UDP-3-O-[3-hydroxymyristoyl] glucosamine N-acyltransferase
MSAQIGWNVFIGDNAMIGENAVIDDGAQLMPSSSVGKNVIIGKRTTISSFCICENCIIGDDTILRAGARIGVEGFRFVQDYGKSIRRMIHTGAVAVGNGVEIGANSAIQRSTFEGNPTVISDGVKIACTVVVGHNTRIGARSIITCHVMISGSNVIGEDVWVGASAVISNGVTIGNRAKVLINAVVTNDVPDDGMVSGFYAMPHRQWKKAYRKLTEFGNE